MLLAACKSDLVGKQSQLKEVTLQPMIIVTTSNPHVWADAVLTLSSDVVSKEIDRHLHAFMQAMDG